MSHSTVPFELSHTKTYRGRNGALAAAAFAGTGTQKPATASIEEKAAYPEPESAPKVQPLPITRPSKNPPRHVERNNPKQPNQDRGQSLSQRTDVTSIQATNTLVKLFESHTGTCNSSSKAIFSRPRNFPLQSASPFKVGLATREKPIEFSRPKTAEGASNKSKVAEPPIRELKTLPLTNARATATTRAAGSFTARPETSKRTASYRGPPPTPPTRGTRQDKGVLNPRSNVRSSVVNDSDGHSSASSYASALDVIQLHPAYGGLSPTLEPGRTEATRSSGQAERSFSLNNLSLREQKSPKTTRDSERGDNVMALKRSLREGPVLSNSLTPQLTANSLANAMVASSLASSRAPSPSKTAPPLPRRHPKSHSLFIRSQSQEQDASRTPSPGRGMRQTMREPLKPDNEDDEDESKKLRGYLLRKHHNKHHEGDRKEWRDEITEAERKRYEGVWAANKGLFMPANDPNYMNHVLNSVVEDVWRRSRLPEHVLEEVWNLVDPE